MGPLLRRYGRIFLFRYPIFVPAGALGRSHTFIWRMQLSRRTCHVMRALSQADELVNVAAGFVPWELGRVPATSRLQRTRDEPIPFIHLREANRFGAVSAEYAFPSLSYGSRPPSFSTSCCAGLLAALFSPAGWGPTKPILLWADERRASRLLGNRAPLDRARPSSSRSRLFRRKCHALKPLRFPLGHSLFRCTQPLLRLRWTRDAFLLARLYDNARGQE